MVETTCHLSVSRPQKGSFVKKNEDICLKQVEYGWICCLPRQELSASNPRKIKLFLKILG